MSFSFQADQPRLILASASIARAAVLRAAGLRFDIVAADLDEAAIKSRALATGASVEATACRLAEDKARTIAGDHPGALVIGADQILVCGGVWFDKPADGAGARAHLLSLRGREHRLVTAVVCLAGEAIAWRHVASPRLVMRDFSDAFLDAYLAAEGDVITRSVGAYRLEGLGAQLFAEIEGDHAAILGLPLLPLLAFLRERGLLLA